MSVKTAPPSDSATSGRADLARLGAPPLPQVNLLPPEVRASRRLGRTKAWLGVNVTAVPASHASVTFHTPASSVGQRFAARRALAT